MAVDHIRRPGIDTMRAHLGDPQVVEALIKGNVQDVLKVLPAGVTREDIEEYLKSRHIALDQAIIQNVQIKADDGAVPAPTSAMFPAFDKGATLSDADRAAITLALSYSQHNGGSKALRGKAAAAVAFAQGRADTDGQAQTDVAHFGEQLIDNVESHTEEYEDFTKNLENQIFYIQCDQQLKAKREELQQELEKIMALCRANAIDPAFVVIALARVKSSEYGLVFSQKGQELMRMQKESNAIAASIGQTQDYGKTQVASNKMREVSTNMQQVTGTMNSLAQQISSLVENAKGMIDSYEKSKADLISKVAPRG